MATRDPMPELCGHADYTECTTECEEKNRHFDQWIRRLSGMREVMQEYRTRRRRRERRFAWAFGILCAWSFVWFVVTGHVLHLAAGLLNAYLALQSYGEVRRFT